MRVSATDLQNAFGKYLALVQKEDVIIHKNGKSVAKLVHYVEPDSFVVHEEAKKFNSKKKISYDEYMELVNSSDQRYELIDGEVYLLASPRFNHQVTVNEISWHFNNYFHKNKACRSLTAPLDIRLFGYAAKFEEDPNVVQPDLVVICDQHKVDENNKYQGIPTLIVEVLSPTTRGKDMAIKLNLYMKSGVSEYWIADADNKMIIQYAFTEDRDIGSMCTLTEEDTIVSTQFEGLQIALPAIFS